MNKKVIPFLILLFANYTSIFAAGDDFEIINAAEAAPAEDAFEIIDLSEFIDDQAIDDNEEDFIKIPPVTDNFLKHLQRKPLQWASSLFRHSNARDCDTLLEDEKKFYDYMKGKADLTLNECDNILFPLMKAANQSLINVNFHHEYGDPIFDYYPCTPRQSRMAFALLTAVRILQTKKPSESLIITSIGSGKLFDTYILLDLLTQLGFKNIKVNIIDPVYPVAYKEEFLERKRKIQTTLKTLEAIFPEKVFAWKYTDQFIEHTGGKSDIITVIDAFHDQRHLLLGEITKLLDLPVNKNAIALELTCGNSNKLETIIEHPKKGPNIIHMKANDH